jgi:uncharacterized LabA/DUF88 family protein
MSKVESRIVNPKVASVTEPSDYEIAVLVAGDADYIPVVEELKRLSKLVYVWFFAQEGLHPDLRLAAEYFKDLTEDLVGSWMRHSK